MVIAYTHPGTKKECTKFIHVKHVSPHLRFGEYVIVTFDVLTYAIHYVYPNPDKSPFVKGVITAVRDSMTYDVSYSFNGTERVVQWKTESNISCGVTVYLKCTVDGDVVFVYTFVQRCVRE